MTDEDGVVRHNPPSSIVRLSDDWMLMEFFREQIGTGLWSVILTSRYFVNNLDGRAYDAETMTLVRVR